MRVSPDGDCDLLAIFIEVSRPQLTLSPQAEKVIVSGSAAGLLAVLSCAFVAAGAPVVIALLPVLLVGALTVAVGRDLRHVARYGWYTRPGTDGSSGPGGHGDPREPNPQLPSGDTAEADWDAFESDFWEHVERKRARELVGA
jgi:hypothetical protein